MKNALIITTIGGFVPQFEMNDVRILQENGYTVHYASDFGNPVYRIDKEELEQNGLILHHIDIKKSPVRLKANMRALRQLKKIIEQEQIHLIHCHNPLGGVIGRMAARAGKGSPYVIYTAHGFHFYDGAPKKNWIFFYPVEKYLARHTDCLITINKEDYKRAKKFRLKKNGRAEHIPGVGVNTIKFQKKEALREPKRQELGIPREAFHIVSVGELNDNKNHAAVICAMAELNDKEIYYTICGDGKNREYLQNLILQYHLEDRVQLLGYRTDVAEILQSADCFAFPSKREGLGIAALEAMACAIPVIAADNRGTREYMEHGRNGIVFHAEYPKELEKAILSMKQSPKRRQKMAENCRKTAGRFNIEATDKIMRRIYREISREQERM